MSRVPKIDIFSEVVCEVYYCTRYRKEVLQMLKGQVLSSEIVTTKEGVKWCVLGVRVGEILGFVWSRSAYKVGEDITLTIGTDFNHRFVVRIANNQ